METRTPSRWVFVIAGLIINLCLGTIYAWSVFRPPLHKEPYNLTQEESVIPFSVFLLAFGISFAFSGNITGKGGPRRSALIGAGLLGVGYFLSSSIAIFPEFSLQITIVTFGLIAGTGCGYAYNPPIAVVGRWFSDNSGLALGLTVMGFGLSALITGPAVTTIISMLGLANTFLILGAVFLIILSLLGSFMKFPPKECKTSSPRTSTTSKATHAWNATTQFFTTKQMMKTSTFYITWLIFLIGTGAGLMVIGYAKLIAIDVTGLRGSLEGLATLSVSVLAVSNAVGRPVFGAVCDRAGPRNTLLAMQGTQLVCLVTLFPYSKSPAILYLTIALFAAAFGAYLSVMPALVSYFFGSKNLGPNYGLYLSAYGIGGVICPILMAVILGSDPTYENYVRGFHVTAGLLLVAIFLATTIKPPLCRKVKSTEVRAHEEMDSELGCHVST